MSTIDEPAAIEPAWEIARLFPAQGYWNEDDYFALLPRRGVEFLAGRVEVLPMPSQIHQLILFFLAKWLDRFVADRDLGVVLPSGMRVRVAPGKYREPDVLFMRAENDARRGNLFWDGADLVMEVVSDDDRSRDLEVKRREYAQAGIPEYWIVDPQNRTITVLALDGDSDAYAAHGEFAPGQSADSILLPGFAVEVAAAFAAGQPRRDG